MSTEAHTMVVIGDLEVFLPVEVLSFEMERAEGEANEGFAKNSEMYAALFTVALHIVRMAK